MCNHYCDRNCSFVVSGHFRSAILQLNCMHVAMGDGCMAYVIRGKARDVANDIVRS